MTISFLSEAIASAKHRVETIATIAQNLHSPLTKAEQAISFIRDSFSSEVFLLNHFQRASFQSVLSRSLPVKRDTQNLLFASASMAAVSLLFLKTNALGYLKNPFVTFGSVLIGAALLTSCSSGNSASTTQDAVSTNDTSRDASNDVERTDSALDTELALPMSDVSSEVNIDVFSDLADASLDSAQDSAQDVAQDASPLPTPSIERPSAEISLFAGTFAFVRSSLVPPAAVPQLRITTSAADAASPSVTGPVGNRFFAFGPLQSGLSYALQLRHCPTTIGGSVACSDWSSVVTVQSSAQAIPLELKFDENSIEFPFQVHNSAPSATGIIVADLTGGAHYASFVPGFVGFIQGVVQSLALTPPHPRDGVHFRTSSFGNFDTSPFALSFFARQQRLDAGGFANSLLYEKQDNDGARFARIRTEGNALLFESDACPVLREEGFSYTQAHHIALSRTLRSGVANSLQMYVDGHSTTSVECSARLSYSDPLWFLPDFQGYGDEFIIYPNAASTYEEQIQNDCAAGFTRAAAAFPAGTVLSPDCRMY